MQSRNYRIIRTLATGGTAVLYQAVQTSLDREVVIKCLHPHLTADGSFTRRFEVEAKAAASLDHENIVRIIDSGISEGRYFIVMEYIDGPSLGRVIERRGKLERDAALLIAREICLGLEHAHRRGIVHRDIKPANIMVTSAGLVKITDFGLAKLCRSELQQTVADTLLGTPLYMSPEQAAGESVDGRSDLFSLGTICYEMLTGEQPFIADTYAAVIQKIIGGQVRPPSRLVPSLDAAADRIVMRALSRDPSRRFESAAAMRAEIEAALGMDAGYSSRESIRRLAGSAEP
ncbi:MAG: serine/threonine-protein kinase, partial [Candidatus Krumholzibacteria bacterium]|nr:serine/threonine-protein kinase [Candidatus Krumholzibacteria bacterium]